MAVRVQVILGEDERELLRSRAEAAGLSLSAWMRQTALAAATSGSAPRISSVDELKDFFGRCASGEQGREPDWDEHMAVIGQSRSPGAMP